MADISKSKKFIFLRNPKSGSTAAGMLLFGMGIIKNEDIHPFSRVPTAQHMNLANIVEKGLVTDEELKDYKIFCFYRDPVDRFMSAFNYMKYTVLSNVIDRFISVGLVVPEDIATKIRNTKLKNGRDHAWNNFDEETKAWVYENLTVDFVLDHIDAILETMTLFFKQSVWLSDPRVTILNYKKLHKNLHDLMMEYGDIKTVVVSAEIFKINGSCIQEKATEEQTKRIAEIYKEDYKYGSQFNQ